jgi:hypothetical protein
VDQIVRLPHPDRSSFERADSNRRFFDGMRPESDAHRCDFHAMPLAVECRYRLGAARRREAGLDTFWQPLTIGHSEDLVVGRMLDWGSFSSS